MIVSVEDGQGHSIDLPESDSHRGERSMPYIRCAQLYTAESVLLYTYCVRNLSAVTGHVRLGYDKKDPKKT